MPAWLVTLAKALAVPVLNWIGDIVRDFVESQKLKREERKKNEKQKRRDSLTRQLQLAKESGNAEKIRELSIALVMLDTND